VAEKIVRQLIDDIDGTDITDGGGEQLEFSVRGVDYRIDLSAANIARFDKALKPFIDAAETVGGARGRRAKSPGSASARGAKKASVDLADIREWARGEGYEVSDRGRIKAEVVEAFHAAH